jgi:hypothetical protein
MNTNTSKMSEHLHVSRYGDFELTDAVRPSLDVQVVPREGFRVDSYRDKRAGFEVGALIAAVSREKLFEVFLELLEPLGPVVDVVLETSHENGGVGHKDLYRHFIDTPVLVSQFYDFEDLLLNDGCTGVAVVSKNKPMEVQFDEHKLLVVYARNLAPFTRVLLRAGIQRDDKLKLITEGEHLHTTDPRHVTAFQDLCNRLGVGDVAERVF